MVVFKVFKVFKAVLIAVVLSLVVMVFVATAWSQEIGSQDKAFEITPEISRVSFDRSGDFKRTGSLYGLSASYTASKGDLDYKLRLEGNVDWGNLKSTSDLYGSFTGVKFFITDVRALGIKENVVNASLNSDLKAGLGYRFVSDDPNAKASANSSYGSLCQMNYLYIPLGADLDFRLGESWGLDFGAEYDFVFYGWINSKLSQLNLGFDDVKYISRSSNGIRGSVKLVKKTETLDFVIEPFLNYWISNGTKSKDLISQGMVIGSVRESKGTLSEYGVKLGVCF